MQYIRIISLTLILVTLTPVLFGQATNSYELHFAEATEQFQNGEYDEARISLQRAIRQASTFAINDPRGPLATSFLGVVEMKRGRVDRAEELHADAISLLALSEDEHGPGTLLAKVRFAEFYLEEESIGDAKAIFREIVDAETPKENPDYLLLARAQWGLAQTYYIDKDWENAGRMGYMARVTLQRLYGIGSREAAKPLPMITEAAIRLGNYQYAKLFLDELTAMHNEGQFERGLVVKLQKMFSEQYRRQQEEDLVQARQRITTLLDMAIFQLGPDDPGYVLTTDENDLLRQEFSLEEREGPGGAILDYGTNKSGDVAFAMTENNRIIAKAVVAVSMSSTTHTVETIHPSLGMFVELFFDPNHDAAIDWIKENGFKPASSITALNTFENEEKQMVFSVDESRELYIFEFYARAPDA